MNKFFKLFMFFIIPATLVMSCKDDDNGGEAAGPPTITSVDPAQALPGEQVTLMGTNLGSVTRVSFGVDQVDYDASATSLSFNVAQTAQPGDVTVTVVNPSGNANTTITVMRQAGPPTVTALSRYHVAPGDEVILVGENLIDVESIQMGDFDIDVSTVETVETTDTLRFTVPQVVAGGALNITTMHGNVTTLQEIQVWGNTILISDFDGDGIRPTWNHAGAMEEPEVRSTNPNPLFGNFLHFQSIPVADAAGRGFAMVQPDGPEGGAQPYPFEMTEAENITLSFWANPGGTQAIEMQVIISTNDPERDIYAAYVDLEGEWENYLINLEDFGLGYGGNEIVDEADRLNPANIIQVDFRFIPANFQQSVQIANVDNVMFLED